MKQEVLAVLARGDPLAERLLEIIVAVGDVLRGASGARRRDARGERAEDAVIERLLRGHRACLLGSDTIEGGVRGDADLAVLQTEIRDQLSGCFGGGRMRGGHQQGCDDQWSHAMVSYNGLMQWSLGSMCHQFRM